MAGASPACTLVSAVYKPSQIEKEWMGNISKWQDDYCAAVRQYAPRFTQMLSIVKAYEAGALPNKLDDALVSQFVYTWQCGDSVVRHTSPIEPLVASLRYPLGLCKLEPKGMSAFDGIVTREYLMMADSSLFKQHGLSSLPQQRAFLFDLGGLQLWGAMPHLLRA